MTGTPIFNRASITEIMESLARWYDFEFEVSPLLDGLRQRLAFAVKNSINTTIIASTGTGMQIDYDGKQITLR